MTRSDQRVRPAEAPDGLTLASRLFHIEPAEFLQALKVPLGTPLSKTVRRSLNRLSRALSRFRHVIPEEYFAVWAHRHLPRLEESPLDILKGEDGFDEFVGLIEGIVRGDFA